MNKDKKKIVVILGPTASGKTGMGVRLAFEFGGEIISADSRQVYRGMDIGTGKDLDEWRELNLRWFQFGAFCPLFRIHGQYPFREIFNMAPENHSVYKSMVYYDKLRYRLMPYIYSLAGLTYHNDYTIMRPLFMDNASDTTVFDI